MIYQTPTYDEIGGSVACVEVQTMKSNPDVSARHREHHFSQMQKMRTNLLEAVKTAAATARPAIPAAPPKRVQRPPSRPAGC